MPSVGTAYLDVRADLSQFNRQLRAGGPLQRQLTRASAQTVRSMGNVTRTSTQAAGALRRNTTASQALTRSYRTTGTAAQRMGAEVGQGAARANRHTGLLTRATGRLGGSFARAARAAGGLVLAYVGLSGARRAISTTEELATTTLRLNKIMGLSITTASQWAAVAKSRGIEGQALGRAFTTLSRASHDATRNIDSQGQSLRRLREHQALELVAANERAKGMKDHGKAERMLTALHQKQSLALEAAGGKSNATVEAFQRLGITVGDLRHGTKDLNGLIFRVADGFVALPKHVNKADTAQRLFGRGAQQLIPALLGGSKALREQMALATKYGATFGDTTAKKLENLAKAQRESKFATLGLQVAFGTQLAPMLTTVINKFSKFVLQMRQGKGAGGDFARSLKQIWRFLQPNIVAFAHVTRSILTFASQHKSVLKVVGAFTLLVTTLKALKFASAVIGLGDVAKAGRGATRVIRALARTQWGSQIAANITRGLGGVGPKSRKLLTPLRALWRKILGGAGTSAGNVAADNFTGTMSGKINKSRRLGGLKGSLSRTGGPFWTAGKFAGIAFAEVFVLYAADKIGKYLNKHNFHLSPAQGDQGHFTEPDDHGPSAVGRFQHLLDTIKHHQHGGTVTTPWQVVGEKGPELARLPRGTRVHSNPQSQRMVGGLAQTLSQDRAKAKRPLTGIGQDLTQLAKRGLAAGRGTAKGITDNLFKAGKDGKRISTRLHRDVGKETEDLRKDSTKSFRRLHDYVTDRFGDMRVSSVRHTKRMSDQVGARVKDMHSGVDRHVKRMASTTSDRLAGMARAGRVQGGKLRSALASSMGSADRAVFTGMSYVGTAVDKELKGFGAKPVHLDVPRPKGLAGAGWVGRRGERGRDSVLTLLGRGEAVLNRHHQPWVEAGLAAAKRFGLSPFGSLSELFGGMKGTLHHMASGGWLDKLPRFAGGVGLFSDPHKLSWRGKVSMFGPPGEPAGGTAGGGSSADPGIATRNRATLNKTAAVSVGAHAADLPQIDLGPAAWTGRDIDITGAGAARMGFHGAFPTDSIGQAVFGGGRAVAGGQSRRVNLLKRIKVRGRGPLQVIAQRVVNKARDAGNRYLERHAPSSGGRLMFGSGDLSDYAFPLPAFGSEQRVDRGQDMEANHPYATTVAVGHGSVVGANIGFPGIQIRLSRGPLAGHTAFYGHNNAIYTKVGASVKPGDPVGQTGNLTGGGDPGHTEIGFMEGYGSQSGHWVGPGSAGGMLMHNLLHRIAPRWIGAPARMAPGGFVGLGPIDDAAPRRRHPRRRLPFNALTYATVPKALTKLISRSRLGADETGEYAERASSLGTAVGGLPEAGWLKRELSQLFQLRNALIEAHGWITHRRAHLGAVVGRLQKRRRRAPGHTKAGKALRAALRTSITSHEGAFNSLGETDSGLLEQLTDVQGRFAPMRVFRSLPPIGTLGGTIFDTQVHLKELGEQPAASDSQTSERSDILAEQLRQANLRTALSEATLDVFRGLPNFGGGGVVPGAPGSPRLIVAHGQEIVTPPGQGGDGIQVIVHGDIHSDRRDPVEVVIGDRRFKAAVKNARVGSRAPLAGARG